MQSSTDAQITLFAYSFGVDSMNESPLRTDQGENRSNVFTCVYVKIGELRPLWVLIYICVNLLLWGLLTRRWENTENERKEVREWVSNRLGTTVNKALTTLGGKLKLQIWQPSGCHMPTLRITLRTKAGQASLKWFSWQVWLALESSTSITAEATVWHDTAFELLGYNTKRYEE
jgi:hypothetical protein